jgi:hypothetical protein
VTRSRFGSTRSRYRSIGAGDQVFAQQPVSTSCPDGYHYVPDTAPSVQGLGACVPNAITLQPLTLRPAATPTTATAPAPAPTCPTPWPWWWLLVAAAAGAGLGYYAQKNQKAVKKNAGRIAGEHAVRIVNAGSQAALARLVG